MVHRVFVLEPKAVQDNDLVVEPWKVRVGIGAVPAEISLVDDLPVFEPAQREPQDFVLPSPTDALPLFEASQHVIAIVSLYPDKPPARCLKDGIHSLEWVISADIALFAVDDDGPFIGALVAGLCQPCEKMLFQFPR